MVRSRSCGAIAQHCCRDDVQLCHKESTVAYNAGDPVATVHVTQPLTGTQKTLPRGDTQARVPKNHDQQASTTQSSCSLPRDASQLELRQPHRKDHGNSAVVAEQEQISVVGSAPVARPS